MLKWDTSSEAYAYCFLVAIPIEMKKISTEMFSLECFFCTISFCIIEEISKIILVFKEILDSCDLFIR